MGLEAALAWLNEDGKLLVYAGLVAAAGVVGFALSAWWHSRPPRRDWE